MSVIIRITENNAILAI